MHNTFEEREAIRREARSQQGITQQRRTIDAALASLDGAFPPPGSAGVASSAEARLILLSRHLASISESFGRAIARVEEMLRSQLTAAIGREIDAGDFDDFVASYYPKLFRPDYVPEPFVYAVRRPGRYPDGALSIEEGGEGGGDPILAFSRRMDGPSVGMPLNAATSVELAGEQHLHAWVRTEFGGGTSPGPARIVARARQFSSFLLCVGRMSGPNTFQPKHAIVVQNKDEVIIPLLLEQLPTPKEFRDAVRSLSPEQREFARAFRTMQLESSVFAVAVVQLRPQLEGVLNLPPDSLTKEIKLTQDLLELFVEYQIPPDLLSYDGGPDAAVDEKLSRVRESVASVWTVVDEARQKELKEAELKANLKAAEDKRRRESRQRTVYHDLNEEVPEMMMMADEEEEMMMYADYADATPDMIQAKSAPLYTAKSLNRGDGAANRHLRSANVGQSRRYQVETDPINEEVNEHKGNDDVGNAIDYSHIAKKLDSAFEELDVESALRPTKIAANDDVPWEKNFHRTLLTPKEKTFVSQDEKKREKDKAFDLLDALSKSGAEPIRNSELHVVVAATHRFDQSLIDTVVRSNVNPISSIERSALIVTSTIHDVPAKELLLDQERASLLEWHAGEVNGGNGKGADKVHRTQEVS